MTTHDKIAQDTASAIFDLIEAHQSRIRPISFEAVKQEVISALQRLDGERFVEEDAELPQVDDTLAQWADEVFREVVGPGIYIDPSSGFSIVKRRD